MCEICQAIIKDIAKIFGHQVSEQELIKLIESSPLSDWRQPEQQKPEQ